MSDLAMFGLPIAGYGLDAFITALANLGTKRRGREAMDIIGQYLGGLEPTQTPAFAFGGTKIGPSTAEGLHLDPIFNTADVFQREAGPRFDPESLTEEVRGDIAGGMSAAERAIAGGRVSGLSEKIGGFLEDESFDAFLSERLGEIGESSRARTKSNREQAISRALARGETLEQAEGDIQGVGFTEARARARQGQQARAAQEALRSRRAETRAGLMTQGAITEAEANAGLTSQLARILGTGGIATGQATRDIGLTGADLALKRGAGAAGAEAFDASSAFNAFINLLATRLGAEQFDKTMGANLTTAMASVLAGLNPPFPIGAAQVGTDLGNMITQLRVAEMMQQPAVSLGVSAGLPQLPGLGGAPTNK